MSEFLDSMPAAYARAFSLSEVREHAGIAGRRSTQLVHAELCAGSSGPRVCVVADDRPGLLALVTDAFLVHGLSIKSAQVYCRRRGDGRSEALDVFELQQPKPSGEANGISAADLSAFVQTLSELVAEDVLASSRPSSAPASGGRVTRVYFDLEALRRSESCCWSRRRTPKACSTPSRAPCMDKPCVSSLPRFALNMASPTIASTWSVTTPSRYPRFGCATFSRRCRPRCPGRRGTVNEPCFG